MSQQPNSNKPQSFPREKVVASLLATEISVIVAAAENMTTRLFAAAHGLPLTGTPEVKSEATFTEKSLGAVILMAGFASDRSAADTLAGRLWRDLNGIAEQPAPSPSPAAPATPAKIGRATDLVPESERVLNEAVLNDRTITFDRPAYMLQVMASLALQNIKRERRGKIVRDFHHGPHRFTIRVESNLMAACISIFANGSPTPLYRTVSFNELWQFARARDAASLDRIARSMIENATLRRISGGRAETDEYAEGVADTDDTNVPEDERTPSPRALDDRDDPEPTMGQLLAQAAKRSGAQPRQTR